MPLPHPHGTGPGEIGHNATIDTGDTPGSTGGRFVGFGEDGTSAIANRSAWALSENIDYLYQNAAGDIAVPAGDAFVSAGGSSYQFGTDVFCGDATYPGAAGASDPEGMLMLFAVLDNQYNELTDGAGHEVRVKRVRESTGVTDIYKTGFATNPWIYFCLVDPVTGVEFASSYNIPPGVQVRIIYGEKSSLEALPTDAFTRYKVQAATEVEAGAFLQDGTRPMTGDADWDGNNLLNLAELRGQAAADMLVHSLQNLDLQGDDLVRFQDQYLASPVPLGEDGTTAILTPTAPYRPSVLGAVNSATEINNLLVGNRTLNRTGSFVSSVTPDLTYPDIDLLVNGQTIKEPAGSIAIPAPAASYLVFYNPATMAVEVMDWSGWPNLMPVGAILLWSGTWSGAAWSNEVDLRWPSGKRGNYFSLYVGDGLGADFSDINLAADILPYFLTPEKEHFNGELVVVGTATLSKTLQLNNGWRVRGLIGEAYGRPKLRTTTTITPATTLIKVETGTSDTRVENLDIYWDHASSNQGASTPAIMCRGPNGVVRNLTFIDGTYKFTICLMVGSNTRVENCVFAGYTESGIKSSGYGCRISFCTFTPAVSAYYCIDVASGVTLGMPNIIEQCKFNAGARYSQIRIGSPCIVRGCYSIQTNATYDPWFVEFYAFSASTNLTVDIYNNVVDYGNGLKCALSTAALVNLRLAHNTFRSLETAFLNLSSSNTASSSRFTISDNVVEGSTQVGFYILDADYCRSLSFVRNRFTGIVGGAMYIDNDTNFEVCDNYFEGFTLSSGSFLSIGSVVGYEGCKISGNYFGTVGAPTVSYLLNVVASGVIIRDNFFECSLGNVGTVILLDSRSNVVSNNRFGYGLLYHVKVGTVSYGCDRNKIIGNRFRSGITKTQTIGAVTDVYGACIYVNDNAISTVIADNTFDSITGRAIEDYGRGTRMHDNTFESIQGKNVYDTGGGTPSQQRQGVIFCDGIRPNISNNFFRNTGYDVTVTGVVNHCVVSEAVGTVISDNQFEGCIASGGDGGADDKFYFVHVLNQSIVNGNHFYKLLSEDDLPRSLLVGIYLDSAASGSVVQGNQVYLFGNTTQANKPDADGIRLYLCTTCNVSNNVFPGYWTAAGFSGDWAINAGQAGAGCVFMGNLSFNENFQMSSVSGSQMCVGNLIMATVTTYFGDMPSNTTYSANGSNPSDDFNQSV